MDSKTMKKLLFILFLLPLVMSAQVLSKQIVRLENLDCAIRFVQIDSTYIDLDKTSVGFITVYPLPQKSVQVVPIAGGSNNYTFGFNYDAVTPSFSSQWAAADTLNAWIGRGGCASASSGGGVGGDSMYVYRLYSDLYNEWYDSTLTPGRKYVITDFETAYDQTIIYDGGSSSNQYKTGNIEPLVVTATGYGTIYEYAASLVYPKDVVKYDIGYNTTYINSNPAKGKIFYREDSLGNVAMYDWRNIMFYNTADSSEYYTFNAGGTANHLSLTSELGLALGYDEYPNIIFLGSTYFNENNIIYGGWNGTYYGIDSVNGCTVFYGEFAQNSNNIINGSIFHGAVRQNTTMQITNNIIGGSMDYCQASSIYNSVLSGNIAKLTNSNIASSFIGGQIDRVVNAAILTDTISGKLYWCSDVAIENSNIAGDISGVKQLIINQTQVNCNIENVTGISNQTSSTGFEQCIINGNNSSSILQYINVQTIVSGKTIDEATYPILFDATSKTIFRGSDNKVYFSYFNGSTTVITEIL
jgi:hypothetical protein